MTKHEFNIEKIKEQEFKNKIKQSVFAIETEIDGVNFFKDTKITIHFLENDEPVSMVLSVKLLKKMIEEYPKTIGAVGNFKTK